MASPRPAKGRGVYSAPTIDYRSSSSVDMLILLENLKNTPCRNIGIYGFCKYEKDGCAYNHDAALKNKTQSPSAGSSERYVASALPSAPIAISNNVCSGLPASRFNVDSPSFTPLQPHTNGLRASAISPRSANAAPFTPQSNNSKKFRTWLTTQKF
jgi:PAB-dependent poly(A)-specific ribonuclease subunit 3